MSDYPWTDPDVAPRCYDHDFTGTHYWWDEDAETWLCRRCEVEARLLDEAGL